MARSSKQGVQGSRRSQMVERAMGVGRALKECQAAGRAMSGQLRASSVQSSAEGLAHWMAVTHARNKFVRHNGKRLFPMCMNGHVGVSCCKLHYL